MATEIFSWGAAQEVTGSKHFLQTPNALIQIDCGMFQGRRKDAYERNRKLPFDCGAVNACVLTHAHFDHCGNLPTLVKSGYDGPIYATPATKDIARIILNDSAHIQQSDSAWAKKRARRSGRKDAFIPLPIYDFEDVDHVMDRFVDIRYGERKEIAQGINITLYDAGHILGSASVDMEVEEGGTTHRVLFSGDLGRRDLPILRDPQHPPTPDVFIGESTYGNRLHEEVSEVDKEMAEVINRTADRGGKIIIPAFAVGRTQEIVYCVHLLTDKKMIPSMPVYVDSPMAIKATRVFLDHPECYDQETHDAFTSHSKNPFGFEELTLTRTVEQSKEINETPGPAIIISASGMAESGRILHHLMNNIEDPRATILIVGYMASHTLGRRIVERHEEVRIFGQEFKLRAEVKILNAFSAHADFQEIRRYLGHYSKKELRDIYLVHGEPDAQKNLTDVLESDGFRHVEAIQYKERYRIG